MPAAGATAADPITGSPVYPLGSRVNDAGHLEIGGCDMVEVARAYGCDIGPGPFDWTAFRTKLGVELDRLEAIYRK